MSNTAIMTDSNCGIMPDEGRDLGIYVLPMPLIIDGQTYYEGVDITLDEFFKRQISGADITTSQPSPGDVEAMWTDLLRTYDEIVFIPMPGGLSSTCQTALILSEEEPFRGRVFVVDNRRISVTQAQSVLDAKLLAEEGKTASQIKEILDLYFCISYPQMDHRIIKINDPLCRTMLPSSRIHPAFLIIYCPDVHTRLQ